MHNVPKSIPQVYLISRNGIECIYKDTIEAANYLIPYFLYDITTYIGENFSKTQLFADCHEIRITYPYILRTEIDDIVTVDDLYRVYKRKSYSWLSHLDEKYCQTGKHFRRFPVPRTGRSSGCASLRNPKTTQEKRTTAGHQLDDDIKYYNIRIRAKRSLQNLPNAWDDKIRSDYRIKNWKQFRKTQWKKGNK